MRPVELAGYERVIPQTVDFERRVENLFTRINYKPDYNWALGRSDPYDPAHRRTVYLRARTIDARPEDKTTRPFQQDADDCWITGTIQVHCTMTDNEILDRLLELILRTEHHEAQEWFRVDGTIWRDPHTGPLYKWPAQSAGVDNG